MLLLPAVSGTLSPPIVWMVWVGTARRLFIVRGKSRWKPVGSSSVLDWSQLDSEDCRIAK